MRDVSRVALLAAVSVALAADSANQECAGCHPAETKLHAQTRMAQAMSPGLKSIFAQRVPSQPLRESAEGFAISYHPVEAGLQVTVERGKARASGIIEWVLGAGVQGQTPLVRVGDTVFESRISYFTRANQFGITVDQPGGNSPNATAALGLKESRRDAASCLLCHATELSDDLEPVIPGVQCARCHAGAAEHAKSRGPVTNPGKLTALGQVKICGACHRITPPVDEKQLENVRFQPLRLLKSRCFASGQLPCTKCHPAHMDVKRNNPAFYNEKCGACHAGPHSDERKAGNCIGCHMPVVQVHQALEFTDHYIR